MRTTLRDRYPGAFSPLAATLAVIGVSAYANIGRINGYRTGQVSDLYPTGFTPAGWVFSIWSLIYVGLVAFAVGQAFGPEEVRVRGVAVRTPFLVNTAANIGWVFAWHHRQIELSFAFMMVVFGTLGVAALRLRRAPTTTRRARLLVDAPFSLYFGWITTATIANFGALCASRGAYPLDLSMDEWALVSVIAAVAVYVAMAIATRDAIYCAVFVWAALGIFLKRSGISSPVQIAAATGAAVVAFIVLGLVLVPLFRPRAGRNPEGEAREATP